MLMEDASTVFLVTLNPQRERLCFMQVFRDTDRSCIEIHCLNWRACPETFCNAYFAATCFDHRKIFTCQVFLHHLTRSDEVEVHSGHWWKSRSTPVHQSPDWLAGCIICTCIWCYSFWNAKQNILHGNVKAVDAFASDRRRTSYEISWCTQIH